MDKLTAIPAASLVLALLGGPVLAGSTSARLDLGTDFQNAAPATLDATTGYAHRQTATSGLRLMWQGGTAPWHVEAHALLRYDTGGDVAYVHALAPWMPPAPPATFFDLEGEAYSDAASVSRYAIDRLSLSYAQNNVVFKIGRQAITWGAGLVFRPGDIVAPFSPNAIDTAYKPGVDMVYGQYLFDNGADIAAVILPRRASAGGDFAINSSTFALRSTMFLGPLDAAVLLAADHGDTILDASLGGPLGEAAWNVELGQWFLSTGETRNTLVANISNVATLGGFNVNYFAEYFYNGFGVESDVAVDAFPAGLADRLANGQLFNTGNNLLALGGMISLNPAVSLSPSLMLSLDDGSAYAALNAQWSISDNADLTISAGAPIGPLGTEFGGRETIGGSGVYLRPTNSFAVNFTRYF